MRALDTDHKNLKMDTLSDNLEFLSSIGTPPFVIKSSEKKGITIYTDTLANTSREVVCLWTKKEVDPAIYTPWMIIIYAIIIQKKREQVMV